MRLTAFFNESYKGTPPWDVGHPQAELVKLAKEGKIRGRVLDVGCGTGENAIFFAGMGLETMGIDGAPLAIGKATRKASERGSRAVFVIGDALHLEKLNQRFDTITDSGLFHVFSDEERILFGEEPSFRVEQGRRVFHAVFQREGTIGMGRPKAGLPAGDQGDIQRWLEGRLDKGGEVREHVPQRRRFRMALIRHFGLEKSGA